MRDKLWITAALAFAGFLICVIIIADRGEGGNWWGFLNQVPYGDKIGHLGLIGTLSLLCNLAFRPSRPAMLPRWITTTTFVLLLLLTLEELSQAITPHRSCDFLDWLADLAGLAAGQILAARLRHRTDTA